MIETLVGRTLPESFVFADKRYELPGRPYRP